MAKSQSNDYRKRLAELKGSYAEQAKELVVPVAIDLASGFAGWWLGRQLGRSSLLIGLATYTGGKFHSLHEDIKREELRLGVYDEEAKRMLSGFSPMHNNETRVYTGDSPLCSLGLGMILGGAFAQNTEKTAPPLGAIEKAKSAFSDITEDLKYRLYLDKIFKGGQKQEEQKQEDKPVSGLTDVDVFIAGDKLVKDLDMTTLEKINEQVENSAIEFDRKRGGSMSGHDSPSRSYAEFEEEVSGVSARIM